MDNDQRIIELRDQIAVKKEKMGNIPRFVPITNCSLEIDGERFNLHTLGEDQLTLLLIKLNLYRMSATELKVLSNFKIGGYCVDDWISDIRSKLTLAAHKAENTNLTKMESKLQDMLSERKKVELEINEIENFLK